MKIWSHHFHSPMLVQKGVWLIFAEFRVETGEKVNREGDGCGFGFAHPARI